MRWSATRGGLLLVLGMLPVLGGCLPVQGPTGSTEALTLYPRPKAAFDVRWLDTDTVEFVASRSFARRGRIVEYEWDFGDGTQAGDVLHVISHRYMSNRGHTPSPLGCGTPRGWRRRRNG